MIINLWEDSGDRHGLYYRQIKYLVLAAGGFWYRRPVLCRALPAQTFIPEERVFLWRPREKSFKKQLLLIK
jgi:hypothetical protein